MNRFKFFLGLLLAVLVIFNGSAQTRRADHVFIISFDQGNPDLIQRSDMPTFHRMAAEGAHDWSAYTIVPSLTLPAQ